MSSTEGLAATFRQVLAEQENGALGGVDFATALAQAVSMSPPTDEQIDAAANAMGEASAGFFSEDSWRHLAREALVAAAGTAPQDHEHSWEPESTLPRRICACEEKPVPSPDREKLIADARSLIESWDRKVSWTLDSPVGMIARLVEALDAAASAPVGPVRIPDRLEVDEARLYETIDKAQRVWNGNGRHEPIAAAITRAVLGEIGSAR